ncbi:molybdenum cofactor biosynthesis protein MoaE [Roseospira marina]|uniref:Molybdopterin synthase catalytic subunit n=1 Tax=Roseospira marina TaxID=140057 RepID=A0A5M6IG77_9PROT|nr:molybdenum cofactor biosynthesis protein MoaE [Roseospira marina]KAA5607214.1 molybdenum cofactor biosynthesis protein MoaE [Roseospira marina]MBB4312636.1 molybdopterin synthase catalytic subunit [Roseospira marina]MBB5085348.1 molybdopterin synthase catalytic subunit [Roseospira marina]
MIRVQQTVFDVGAEIAAFTQGTGRVGGVATFTGLVRDYLGEVPDGAPPVRALTLEHYPGMTERQLERIEAEARRRWDLADVLVIHRFGRMAPGEPIVLVCTTSAHRTAALESCQFLIDWLKTRAPFWKREETPSGDHWVEARADDDDASARWDDVPDR